MSRNKAVSIFVIVSMIFLVVAIEPASANPGTRLDSIILLLSENFDEDEGAYSLYGSEAGRVEASYGAAVTLETLGYYDARPPTYDLVKLSNFTRKLQWESAGEQYERYGGFSQFIAGYVNIESTFQGVRVWEITRNHLDIPDVEDVEINETAIFIYVNKTHRENGGFGRYSLGAANLYHTYLALYVMDRALRLSENPEDTWEKWLPNRTLTIDFIMECFDGSAFRLSPESDVNGITATASALLALEILGELSQVMSNYDEISDWILERQIDDSSLGDFNGGFEEGVLTNDSNLISTYNALLALNLTGSLDLVNESNAARFVLNCQSKGGWNSVPSEGDGDLPLLAEAITCLDLLEMTSLLYEEDPNNPAPLIIDWRGLFIIGFIIVAAVIGFISMRIE